MQNENTPVSIKMARSYWSVWHLWVVAVIGLLMIVMKGRLSMIIIGSESLSLISAGLGLGLLLGGLFKAFYMRIYSRYHIKSDRIDVSHGVFSRRNTSIYMEHIRSVDVSKSLAGMILGYGDLLIGTSGTGDSNIKMRDIDEPMKVQQLILDIRDGNYQAGEGASDQHAGGEPEQPREEGISSQHHNDFFDSIDARIPQASDGSSSSSSSGGE